MEVLVSLFPEQPRAALEAALRHAKFDVDTAATLVIEGKVQIERPSVTLPDVSGMAINVLQLAKDVKPDKHMILQHEHLPTAKTSAFMSLKDGNCCPHAMALCLAFLTDSIPSKQKQHVVLSTCMRDTVMHFLALNWEQRSLLTDLPWHQIVYFAHNLSIPDSEREQFPDWGCTSEERWTGWSNEASTLYFHTSEILALCEMMRMSSISLPITFRLWRTEKGKIYRSGTIPENVGDSLSYVFDLTHEGEYDTNRAHWKLVKSGSAYTAYVGSSSSASSSSSRKRDDDPEYEPPGKKKRSGGKAKLSR